MTRARAFEVLLASLGRELQAAEQMVRMSRDEATHGESKAENKYDTRSLEASYLAAGQGERVLALRRLVSWLDTAPRAGAEVVALGSIVALEDEEGAWTWMVLLPDGGGHRVDVDGEPLVVVTPDAPMGRVLLGLEPGDGLVFRSRDLEVAAIG